MNAQFSIRYCVANALVRKGSTLAHFEADAISDPEVLALVERIEAVADPALDARGHTAMDMRVVTKDGREYFRQTDVAPGFPEKPLTKEEHLRRFRDCVAFAANPPAAGRVDEIIAGGRERSSRWRTCASWWGCWCRSAPPRRRPPPGHGARYSAVQKPPVASSPARSAIGVLCEQVVKHLRCPHPEQMGAATRFASARAATHGDGTDGSFASLQDLGHRHALWGPGE